MKLFATLALVSAAIASVSAHSSMLFPPARGHPRNPNAVNPDFNCITAPFNGGAGCPAKPFPCGGYAPDKVITTTFTAGQTVDVKFTNPNFSVPPSPATAGNDQARHNGGLCEFALSYNGGKQWTKIATYTKGCPDIFFTFKVKIPDAAPSCNNCLFSWSWINAVGNREFYQNCADIKIVGKSTAPLPIIDITKANLPAFGGKILTPPGDNPNTGNTKGNGPTAAETNANLALKIGGGGKGGNVPVQDPKPGKGKDQDPNPGKGKDQDPNPGKGKEEPANPGKGKGKPAPIKVPADGSCSTQGAMTCVDSGVSPAFNTCDNGKEVSRSCPSGTVCTSNGDTIDCTLAKRRFIQRRIKANHKRV